MEQLSEGGTRFSFTIIIKSELCYSVKRSTDTDLNVYVCLENLKDAFRLTTNVVYIDPENVKKKSRFFINQVEMSPIQNRHQLL